ncbi:hypothetical protein CEXT_772811 [Caerostris extrusa]|uniref:Uncharacterized protein n=1 Tax=Caerostris extrusa TaxID=172846 RepID=A0AAV4UET7_CAEEX|nr:hypothetical protein CEXT_772811 [Caerostris extrusa]
MGCQPAGNEVNKDRLVPPSGPFSTRIPDSIRMHKRTTGNDFPKDGSGFYRPLESFREESLVNAFFPHFTAERARLYQTQHFIELLDVGIGSRFFSVGERELPCRFYFSREYFTLNANIQP